MSRAVSEIHQGDICVKPRVQVTELKNSGDKRGYSFTAPPEALEFLGRALDVHLASIAPAGVRGNHFHLRRREAIVVVYNAEWSLHWDEGEHTPAQHLQFTGAGARLILVEPGSSHAVRNDGAQPISLVALSSEVYDPAESVVRKVT